MTAQPRPVKPEEAEPYDASNPDHVRAAKKKAEIKEDLRREGLRFILSDRRGRAWLRHLISEKLFTRIGGLRPAPIFTGNSTTFYNSGGKELGDILATEAYVMSKADFRLMEDEGDPSNG